MATGTKTLDAAGVLLGVDGQKVGSPQMIEDMFDALVAVEAVALGGDITSVVAGAGLTGGATSGAATLDIGAGTNIAVNANDVALATNVDVAGTLDVTGAATFDAAVHAVGAATLDSTLGVTGVASLLNDVNKFGAAGAVYIKGQTIGFAYDDAGVAVGYINLYATSGATGQYRNLIIANGDGAPIASFTGLTKLTELAGALAVTGAVTFGGDAPVATRLLSVGPVAAKATDDVHALYDDVTAEFPGPFTNPVVPRNLRVTFSADWDGGDVTVTGTDQFDAVVNEVFADVAATTVVGTKIFKTVTGATKETPAGVTGDGASIGTGDKVGIPIHVYDTVACLQVGTTNEAVTVDATYDGFTPTTTPAATTYVLLVNVDLSQQ